MASQSRYVIGIDLGTTNCALAFASESGVTQFEITQLAAPNELRDEPLLPSCLFLHGAADFPKDSIALPWDESPRLVTGLLAKSRGTEIPARLIASAKSWLSHSGVDRTAALLPLNAPEGVSRLSPVEASRSFLEHLKNAWSHRHPDAPLEKQQLLVTVPASFDAVARDLTLQAASDAGYRDVVLLEEPQAAFYAWIERHPDWRQRVQPGDLILVVDVGGGTTDFTLILVTQREGELALERVAVGEHILLGGDNMDLALAHLVREQLSEKGTKLDTLQFHALWQSCRAAKEKLLAAGATEKEQPVTVLGKGTRLVGGTIKAKLLRSDVERVLVDGFFPEVSSTDLPAREAHVALQEIGLPYATDAAVTRHLARFLRQAATSEHSALRVGPSGIASPTHVLFNGGVFHAAELRSRVISVLNQWLAGESFQPVVPLEGEDLMHAVSRGAAYYGLARQGKGIRIRGGIPRSYYIGVQSSMPAVPGMRPPLKALTVATFGMEEGTRTTIPGKAFNLLLGQAAVFRFFSSVERKDDPPGLVLEEIPAELEELSPIEVMLPAAGDKAEVVTVSVETDITETGQLQMWCVSRDGRRWKLEFNVRETARR